MMNFSIFWVQQRTRMGTRFCHWFALATLFAMLPGISKAQSQSEIDFNRDIRPILSDNCFLCHGPAESTREAGLRLDVREDAIDAGGITPGEPDESLLVQRILSTDPDEVMPPPSHNKHLTQRQKDLLKQWVSEGAEYQKHWAFVPPKKSEKPDANPIDHYIDKKLVENGLARSPEAKLETLIRRVSLDLNGMPATPKQVQMFLQDVEDRGIEKAYEQVVDRLLASPAYGERMTLNWLDAARYGDTSVMHADGPRDMWPWRDWVINAYNANMPFDQFTVEQLAGDLIPNATLDQKIASGFNRNHATSDEGGAFAEELRVEYVVDRVMTTSTVWMALTMECSQCHDHKYDPISQEEYYRFFAYFNNTADPGMQTRNGNQSPVVEVVDQERQKRLAIAKANVEAAKKKVEEYRTSIEPEFKKWLALETEKALASTESSSQKASELAGLEHWFPLNGTDNKLVNHVTGDLAKLEKGRYQSVDREGSKALQLNGNTQFACSETPIEVQGDQPFSLTAWIKSNGKSGGAVFSRMDVSKGYRGYDMWIQGRSIGTHIINTWPSNAIKVVSKDQLKPNTWQHVVISYDGSQKSTGVKIFIDGKLSENSVEADTLSKTIETDTAFRIGSRSNGGNWKGAVDDIRIYRRALSAEEAPRAKDNPIQSILAMKQEDRSDSNIQILREFFLTDKDEQFPKLSSKLAKTTALYDSLNSKPTTSMVMKDNPSDKMRMTYILDRGLYNSPKKDKPLDVGVPAALPALPEDAPANRLGLARWLTQPDHPLTARVAVNRYWMMLFGNGLVRTASDFGAQGAPPTHPELLDWLAVDFVESGWDVKRMIKQIVMSQTYRQSSRRSPELQKQDPENYWLAFSPRFRLQGELIRDQALSVSGLLVDQVGGPSVKPYQPPNIWNEVSLNGGLRYPQDKGEKLYRKSMYTYWKRSAPMPNMMIFDSPSREKCTVQRARTNTPLQALVTLNDPQFVEAARVLAQRLIVTESNDQSRIQLAYQLCTSRSVQNDELEIIQTFLDQQRKLFANESDKAQKLLAVGEAKRDASINPAEHAAWTVVSQMILNLDETLTRN